MDLTPSQTIGPFFGFALPLDDGPYLVAEGHPAALLFDGRVLDGTGDPVPDALLEIGQAVPPGEAQDLARFRGFGRCPTDARGRFFFVTAKPAATAPYAPHLDLMIFARGLLRHLVTRVYFPDEAAANATDPILTALPGTRRHTLVARRYDSPTAGMSLDIRLQGEHETVFFDV